MNLGNIYILDTKNIPKIIGNKFGNCFLKLVLTLILKQKTSENLNTFDDLKKTSNHYKTDNVNMI
jgi:hypothetical protein